MVQHAGRRDDHVALVAAPLRRREVPPSVCEFAADDLLAEGDERTDLVAPGAGFKEGLDLLPGREQAAPVRVEVERIAVEMRGDVARQSGIGVLSPRAS